MELILGLLAPLLILAAVGLRPGDGNTHWRYFVGPVLLGVLALIAVLTTDAGNTPDFWVGICGGLAAIFGAALGLILEGFLPLSWWTREEPAQARDA